MFRQMRRKKQALSKEECTEILKNGTNGVLAVEGDNGYPYAVPLSFVQDGENIYFHTAKCGHKLDAVKRNHKASFCVVAQDEIVPEEYTTYFRSVIVFGRIRILESEEEKRAALEKLAVKYAPETGVSHRQRAIEKELTAVCMLEMQMDYISGKEAIELARKKK